MTKRKGIFDIEHESPFIPTVHKQQKRTGITIEQALNTVLRQMEVEGFCHSSNFCLSESIKS